MRNDLCIVLTAKMSSERLPGKAMADVAGKPLIYWIARRLQGIGKVIMGVTPDDDDLPLVGLAEAMGIPVYRWRKGDVVGTIDGAVRKYHPNARFVMRGLGDCPFMAAETIDRACDCMGKYDGDAFAWALAPTTWPVYGSREFPYTRKAWDKIAANSTTREHADMYFHEHRDKFNIIYHEPPRNIYFRSYRLEVDWMEDLVLVRKIAEKLPMLSPLPQIITFLDNNQHIARINRERIERTGPTCYDYETQRAWAHEMTDKPIIAWDNTIWNDGDKTSKAQPVFCRSGQCLLGVARNGILYTKQARVKGDAYLKCECGSGLAWKMLS